MKVEKMIRGKSGMFHEPNPATTGEQVAVIPWNEWEAEIKAAREEVLKLVKTRFYQFLKVHFHEGLINVGWREIEKSYQERFNDQS